MASRSNTSTLLLASLLCLVLLSEVGMLMAEAARSPVVYPNDPCPAKCAKRCSLNGYTEMCNEKCVACCHRCPDRCVPNGPKASRDSCPCYAKIMTHGKHKCP